MTTAPVDRTPRLVSNGLYDREELRRALKCHDRDVAAMVKDRPELNIGFKRPWLFYGQDVIDHLRDRARRRERERGTA